MQRWEMVMKAIGLGPQIGRVAATLSVALNANCPELGLAIACLNWLTIYGAAWAQRKIAAGGMIGYGPLASLSLGIGLALRGGTDFAAYPHGLVDQTSMNGPKGGSGMAESSRVRTSWIS
jgi:hypothetical protein